MQWRTRGTVAALVAGLTLTASTGGASARAETVRAGDAVATVSGGSASLRSRAIERVWRIRAGGALTSALDDPRDGRDWSTASAPDFSLSLAGVPTSSSSGWRLVRVEAERIPLERPDAGRGVEIDFKYKLAAFELERRYSVYPGAEVIGVDSELDNTGPAPARVDSWSLDQITNASSPGAEVFAYHGGSDYRDDFRDRSVERGAFDDEGEVVRFDDGHGRGWFFVAERRGGALSRVGRDASGRAWVGVDPARDLLDEGPLGTSPPNYNSQPNPLYPAPVRARVVPAFGTLDLGRAYTGVYSGGEQAAAAAFVSDFAAHAMPHYPRTVGLNTFHPWEHGPGLSDANLRPQVLMAKSLGVEAFMLDDQWQGSSSGDWQFDPSRFPGANDTPDFVRFLHAEGLSLGLWMSPLEFNPRSATYAAHRDWACTPTGDVTAQIPDDAGLGVWDVTNPAFRAYLSGVVDRLVHDYSVREFKFDYMAWVDCPPHDYLDYEDAFVALVRSLEARHPHVTFELDETNDQRAWPFESAALGPSWFDNGHLQGGTAQSRLLHDIWSTAPWLPTSSIGFGTYDGTLAGPYGVDYLMPMALLGHVTFWTDLTKLSPVQARETAWWIGWYKAHRHDLSGVVYEDTASDPLDGRSWAVFQPWSGGRGELFAFRQGEGPAALRIALHGTVSGRRYELRDARSGRRIGVYRGRRLAAGLTVRLPAPYSARVIEITPAR